MNDDKIYTINISPDMNIQKTIDEVEENNVIILLSDGEYNGEGNNNIEVNKENLTIKGVEGANVIINAEGTGNNVFNINANNTTLENLIITGSIADKSAVIINSNKNTIKNCRFNKNISNSDGGVISVFKGSLNVIGSTFNKNKTHGDGGAIANKSTLTVTESIFNINTSEKSGGAINNKCNLTVSKSIFRENKAINGGAISNDDNNCNITESKFIENTAKEIGGAINNNGYLNVVSESKFNKNTAKYGGAIVNSNSLIITESKFIENKTRGCGGAIFNYIQGSCNITESEFNMNTAGYGGGGGIVNLNSLTINKSKFTGNITKYDETEYGDETEYAGAINNKKGNCTIIESTFTENRTENSEAIVTFDSLTVKKSKFTNNQIYDSKNEKYINYDCNWNNILVEDSIFSN
jgi:hypothetical protein